MYIRLILWGFMLILLDFCIYSVNLTLNFYCLKLFLRQTKHNFAEDKKLSCVNYRLATKNSIKSEFRLFSKFKL